MRTSCRFAIAVHVLALLAYKEGDRISSTSLAASVNTNPVIIRRMLLALQRAKLIETNKGAGAGSRLSRSPRRINLAEIYRAVEDSEAFSTPSRKPDKNCPVGQCIRETLDTIFTSAQAAMEKDLQKKTLADVIETIKSNCGCDGKKGA